MGQKSEILSAEEKQMRVSAANRASMFIASIIWEDILVHVCDCEGIKAIPMVWEGQPGFIFETNSAQDNEKLERFWDALLETRVNGYSITIDSAAKGIAFDYLENIPDFINSFLSCYGGPYKELSPIDPIIAKSAEELEPEDLLLLKRDSFLGREDLSQDFLKAQKLVGRNFFMHFRYLPYDLERSVNTTVRIAQGNYKGHPTWDSFYIN